MTTKTKDQRCKPLLHPHHRARKDCRRKAAPGGVLALKNFAVSS